MRRFIKNNLKVFVAVIISAIIFGGIGVYAASQYFAKDISFTPTNENFKKENGETINNVEDALNQLYTKREMNLGEIYKVSKYYNVQSTYEENMELDTGKYICFSSYSIAATTNFTSFGVSNANKIEVSGCNSYNELNDYHNYQPAKEKFSNLYLTTIAVGKVFTCNTDSNKNIIFNFGNSNSNTSPMSFETSCIKID